MADDNQQEGMSAQERLARLYSSRVDDQQGDATPAAGRRGGGETREERDAGQHVHRASGGGETRERYRAAGGGRAFLRVEASEEDGGEVGAAAGDRRGDGEGMGA